MTALPPATCPKAPKAHARSTVPRSRWVALFGGIVALVWFLIRVVPKPSRASYPCQQAALASSGAFLGWLLGVGGSATLMRKALHGWRHRRVRAAVLTLCAAAGIASAMVFGMPSSVSRAYTPTDLNQPLGVARGIYPGRVVWAYDPAAVLWNGNTGHYWDPASTDQAAVDAMLSRSLQVLTGTTTDSAAWNALFATFNTTHKSQSVGYTAGETIVIKINQNTARTDHTLNGNTGNENSINATPAMVLSLLKQLINGAGVPQADITVYDASRYIGDSIISALQPDVPQRPLHGRLRRRRAGARPVDAERRLCTPGRAALAPRSHDCSERDLRHQPGHPQEPWSTTRA